MASIYGGVGRFRGRNGQRDSKRQRSYDAENSTSMMQRREFGKAPSLEVCQQFIDGVLKRSWLRKEYGTRRITVTHNGGAGGSRAGGSMMYMSTYNRHKLVLLHELAHCLTPTDVGHGRKWARCYLMLVTRVMGATDGAELRAAFRKYGVKFRLPTAAQKASGKRLAALAKERGHGGAAALAAYRERQQADTARLVAAGWVYEGGRSGWRSPGGGVWMTRAGALAQLDKRPETRATPLHAPYVNERAAFLTERPAITEPVPFAGAYWPE